MSRRAPALSLRIRTSWLTALLASVVAACGTDAVGIGACRQVEQARCEAAAECGLIEDVAACQRYFRDHCLHGVALESAPRNNQLRACVETIESAGRCADRHGPDTDPAECGSDRLSLVDVPSVCDVVEAPERAPACAFLEPDPDEDDDRDDEDDDAQEEEDPARDASADAG